MCVGGRPPDLVRSYARVTLQLFAEVVVKGRQQGTDVRRDKKELRCTVIHGDNAVVDLVVNASRFSGAIAVQPLGCVRCDVHLHARSPKGASGFARIGQPIAPRHGQCYAQAQKSCRHSNVRNCLHGDSPFVTFEPIVFRFSTRRLVSPSCPAMP